LGEQGSEENEEEFCGSGLRHFSLGVEGLLSTQRLEDSKAGNVTGSFSERGSSWSGEG
jgi:hypothetical protein